MSLFGQPKPSLFGQSQPAQTAQPAQTSLFGQSLGGNQQQTNAFGGSLFQQKQQQPQQQQQPQPQQQQQQQQQMPALSQSQAQLSNSLWQPGKETPRMQKQNIYDIKVEFADHTRSKTHP